MSWRLGGNTIPAPQRKQVNDSLQEVTHRSLNGRITRDFIGTSKIVLVTEYTPISQTDYNIIRGHFLDQVNNGTTKALVVDELGLSMNVLINVEDTDYRYSNHYDYRNCKVTYTQV